MVGIIKVGIADMKICTPPDGLMTLGLGSCVGIAIRDPMKKLGGLVHIMLPDSKMITTGQHCIAKFADSGIEELVRQLEQRGARRIRLVAKIAGGATMFDFQGGSGVSVAQVGGRNVEASVAKLRELKIPIVAQDTGANYGRTVVFYPETGAFHIRAVGRPEKII